MLFNIRPKRFLCYMEYKTNNMNMVWCHYKFTSDAFKCEIATMFDGFNGDNANLEKSAPSVEESLAIGRMPLSREMRFLFMLTYLFLK